MSEREDIHLFDLIKKGDKKALDQLFRRYYHSLSNFSIAIVKDKQLTEEIVADIFYILWRDRGHLNIHTSLKSYLFTAVRYKSVELSKKSNQSIHLSMDALAHSTCSDTPESDILYHELNNQYQNAYNALPERCKEVFRLHKLDGFSYKQISEILNISLKTVEAQMAKALRQIRAHIVQYQDHSLPNN